VGMYKDTRVRILSAIVILGVARRARSLYYTKAITTPPTTPVGGKRKGKRDGLDPKFMAKLTKLLRIVIPSWFCKESALIALFSGFLVTRTMV
jgi:hypothetical protein